MFCLVFHLLMPLVALYFLPAIVASARQVHNVTGIFAINLFLGWTLIGWVVALVWALADLPRYAVAYIAPPPYNR